MRGLDPDQLRHLTFLVPNETELVILTGMPVGNDDEVVAAARSLLARGTETVVVTLGSRGALLVTAAEVTRIAPVRVTPVDTTGAGDAFIGSFACFYVQTGDLRASLDRAARYAADSITRRGTQKAYATAEAFARLNLGPG